VKVAVASGKGGTGKTMVAVALARSVAEGAGRDGAGPLLLDCDVEAPDAHLFLHPAVDRREAVAVPVPKIDESRCDLCGECARVCQFNAIAILGDAVQTFPALCHGCGSCALNCPERAIIEEPRVVGRLEAGSAAGIRLAWGLLNVGEAMAVPVIRRLKAWSGVAPEGITILDSPPGASCPMVETVDGCDYVLLVTEPTPFGLHDLELAVAIVRELGLPAGVVVNRDGPAYPLLDAFCDRERLPILLRIPFARSVAEAIARGQTLLDAEPSYGPRLRRMAEGLCEQVRHAPVEPALRARGIPGIVERGMS